MNVFVTGGAGYKGSVLVPLLRSAGHKVTTLDTCWFGGSANRVEDVRGPKSKYGQHLGYRGLEGFDAVIHLANIANDPCGEMDAKLTWEENVLATQQLAMEAVRCGVRQFIFASSASIYGIQGDRPVSEDTRLEPVTDYNKTKMVAERVLMSFADKMAIQLVRPATVCGYSPRMRLDVVVNALTILALTKGEIQVMTPELWRPHCHIEDAARVYLFMLERPWLTGAWNAGFENQQIKETAAIVGDLTGAKVIGSTESMDKRSYLVDSSKLLSVGFQPRNSVRQAVADIVNAYRDGKFKDETKHYNLKAMREQGLLRT